MSASTNGLPMSQETALVLEAHATLDLLGPTAPPQASMTDTNPDTTPLSPYTSQRTAVRNLTLPTNPKFDIPPSPPGSPTSVGKKFDHFKDLKEQGIHFNAKLASSSALKNLSLLPKLMDFAGVEESLQYATTLPRELWSPLDFPEWAYKEVLEKGRLEVTKRKEEERAPNSRESIDFISTRNSMQPSKNGVPAISTRAPTGSAAERVMAGLDRGDRLPGRPRSDPDL